MELINYTTLTPTLGGSFSNGWEVMKRNFLYLLLVVIVIGLVSSPSMSHEYEGNGFFFAARSFFSAIFVLAYSFLFLPVITYSSKLIYIAAVREQEIEMRMLIEGFNNYLNIILANLLKFTLIGMGFVFFIIPGFVIASRLAFVSYLVMDKKLDPIQALERSWKMTRGIGWNIFFMYILSIFIFIGGLICLIIGVLPALIWISSSFASIYQAALNRETSAS